MQLSPVERAILFFSACGVVLIAAGVKAIVDHDAVFAIFCVVFLPLCVHLVVRGVRFRRAGVRDASQRQGPID
jgi:hypothetical protein